MSIEINETIGAVHTVSISEKSAPLAPVSQNSIMVDIEGIHAGITRNFNRYMAEALKGSVASWTKPYRKPVIMHHNEKSGQPIGRILAVEYVEKGTLSNTPALIFSVNIPDKEGREQIEDGRMETVSIGAILHDVRCSICGQNLAVEGVCEHEKGETYGNKLCTWDIYKMEGKEISYVNVPSDIYAKNIRIYKPGTQITSVAASLEDSDPVKGEMHSMNLQELLHEKTAAIESLQADKVQMTADLETVRTELAQAKESNEDLSTKLTAAQESITELGSKLEQATAEVSTAKEEASAAIESAQAELAVEKGLKETLELQLSESAKELKKELVDMFSTLRKITGLSEMSAEELAGRSNDSLRDGIRDMVEELSVRTKLPAPVANPSLSQNNEKPKSVKESNAIRNIDLEKEVTKIFSDVASFRK